MIVLDDPANPFSLIFSIRKIPNDLLDLECLNRPGESVPSRESRTSTLKGLFLLEGPAAALCIGTADFRCLHETDMPTTLRDVRFQGQSGKHMLASSFSGFDPERTSQSQSRPVVPDRGPDLSRRVAALKRCIYSSVFSAFSSSCMSFDFLGASLRRSLSSTLPTESLSISAIVTYSAPRGVVERRFERSSSARPAGAACPKISVPLRYVNSLELTFACDRSPSSPRSRGWDPY